MGKQGTGRARFPGCPSTLAIPGVFREAEVFLRSFRRRHLILPDMTWNRLFSSDFYPLPMRLGHFRRETSAYFHSLIRYSYYFSFEQKCSLIEQYFACFFFSNVPLFVYTNVSLFVYVKRSLWTGAAFPSGAVSRAKTYPHICYFEAADHAPGRCPPGVQLLQVSSSTLHYREPGRDI